MWGTEAHENWFLLHYDAQNQLLLVHVCAFTEEMNALDAITMVLQKEGNIMTEELAERMQQRAIEILGEKHGRMVRIQECTIPNVADESEVIMQS
jgi:hypothetical protein